MNSYSIELVAEDQAAVLSALREVSTPEVEVETYKELTVATILLTAAAAVKLFTALVELRNKLKAQSRPAAVEVKNAEGATLDLLKASDEALKQFAELAK
jgi:hypothetical protein